MPKAPMTPEEIESTREKILETALDIIIDEGFNNLSIRKIASRLGITATTIYNYYKNKDELNLMIRMRGFEKLYDLMTERSEPFDEIGDQFKAMIRGFIEFGVTYASYYDIMFNLHTPKYLDYVGTDMEQIAHKEKESSVRCLALFIEPISAYFPGKGEKKDQFVSYQVVKYWSDLHGLITLYNSRLFHEVMDDVKAFVEERTIDLVDSLLRLKARIDAGEVLF
ncbi:MAG: TetR/AcrR family transcriptional regulator [Proteobacteria bacterium]|nr:TetR/AcrR family transcriptional regulator [Pseudomonadota bacterium]